MKSLLLIVSTLLIILSFSCSQNHPIVGSWQSINDSTEVQKFTSDGKLTAEGAILVAKYEFISDNKIEIVVPAMEELFAPQVYEVYVKNDTLILISHSDDTSISIRVK